MWATCAVIGGKFAGSVAGLMNMIGGAGAILSPMLIPVVKEELSHLSLGDRWQIIFIGLGAAWFIAAFSWLFVDASRQLSEGMKDEG
jgi:hypothetical protein